MAVNSVSPASGGFMPMRPDQFERRPEESFENRHGHTIGVAIVNNQKMLLLSSLSFVPNYRRLREIEISKQKASGIINLEKNELGNNRGVRLQYCNRSKAGRPANTREGSKRRDLGSK